MKVWITKYALTVGIQEREVKEVCSEKMVDLVPRPGELSGVYVHKPDWHETRAKAVARARQMQAKRLVSLQKQLRQIANLRFR